MTIITYKVYSKSICNFFFYFVNFFTYVLKMITFMKILFFFSCIIFIDILYLNNFLYIIYFAKIKYWKNSLIKPMLTSLSNLALTVGVVIPVSLDICLNDFIPSFKNDFIIAMSLLSRCKGILCTM